MKIFRGWFNTEWVIKCQRLFGVSKACQERKGKYTYTYICGVFVSVTKKEI